MDSSAAATQSDPAQYARFSRRAVGILIDWILMIVVGFGALFIAISVGADGLTRPVGFLIVIALVLYEPVMVSMTGSTLGHYYANLRVVDDRNGNVSFLKAIVRFIIKSILGWYSFILITTTRRNQALHDQLTRSTVQIRNAAKARPRDYITERTVFANPDMPPRWLRAAMILVYVALAFAASLVAYLGLVKANIVSSRCINTGRCTSAEDIISGCTGLLWIGVSLWLVSLGWRGKLWGARLRAGHQPDTPPAL